jgi:beta-glucosidase
LTRAIRLFTSLLILPGLALLTLSEPRTLKGQTPREPYRNPSLPVEERVRDLLARMTLEEKFWQLFMIPGDLDDPAHDYSKGVFGLQISVPDFRLEPEVTSQKPETTKRKPDATDQKPEGAARAHAERINAIQRFFVERTRLGIPIVPFDEAVHGLAREGATMFPHAIALAATWDPGLVERVGGAIARETRSRGIRQVLSPVVNIASDVRWGRVEETYGEDPYLSSVMGRAFVSVFERAGIVATPKHFVANVGEGGRDSYPIELTERALAERFYPPFETAIRQGRARSIMTAYNSVDGSPATQNRRLLTETLRRDWGFEGFVISDASATGGATVLHMTEPNTPTAAKHAFEAGLDVVFQSSYPQFRPYWQAVERGLVAQPVIDAAVARVLRAKFELGLFERPYVDPGEAARWNGHADHRALAREAARASIVLLKNDRNVLPLEVASGDVASGDVASGDVASGLSRKTAVKTLAVIGTDAVEARLGGYSGPGIDKISILEGIRRRLGSANVRYAPGPGRTVTDLAVIPAERFSSVSNGRTVQGLQGEYFDNNRLAGQPRLVRTDPRIDFRWTLNAPARGIPFDWYSVRWTGTLTAAPGGVRRIGVEGNDGYRLYLDGSLVIDNWRKQSYGRRVVELSLQPGSPHDLRLEYFESTGNARVKLLWDAGVENDGPARIAEAVSLVRASDVALVVAGLEEGEFRDRAYLGLPGRQEALIEAVASTGKPVIVVLIGGSAVTMSRWIDRVAAVLHAWYPGEEGGNAVADVLFGDANPAGRLPVTFPMSEGQLPLYYNHKPTGRGDDYVDLTGQPLFPFGFGLSYTTFDYSSLAIEPTGIEPSGRAVVRCTVKNTGTRAGDEVVQLYVRDVLASVARPVMELKGFRRVRLEPGQQVDVSFELGPEHLRMLDRDMEPVVEPGAFRVMVGGSSKDIRLRGQLTVR